MCSERRVKVERRGKKKEKRRKMEREKERKKKRSLKKTWRQGIDNVSGGRWVLNFEF